MKVTTYFRHTVPPCLYGFGSFDFEIEEMPEPASRRSFFNELIRKKLGKPEAKVCIDKLVVYGNSSKSKIIETKIIETKIRKPRTQIERREEFVRRNQEFLAGWFEAMQGSFFKKIAAVARKLNLYKATTTDWNIINSLNRYYNKQYYPTLHEYEEFRRKAKTKGN